MSSNVLAGNNPVAVLCKMKSNMAYSIARQSNPADHTRGSLARDRDNEAILPLIDLAVAWCALGGLIKRCGSRVPILELPGEIRESIATANDLHGPVAAARELQKLLGAQQPHETENTK